MVVPLMFACRESKLRSALSGGPPDAVVRAAVALQASTPYTVPDGFQYDSADESSALTAADRANGTDRRYRISWTAPGRGSAASDAGERFTLTHRTSGEWDAHNLAAFNADGSFLTNGEDFSGTYAGTSPMRGFRDVVLILRREGTTHVGEIRFWYGSENHAFRIIAFHWPRAGEQIVCWLQDLDSTAKTVKATTVHERGGGFHFNLPGQASDFTFRRRS
ncbi:MAG TPA: hypothetical protein VFN10_19390 [Thermoanaerobaculia bacterium]|nr:hypothetical protein [Thermoanaerobaculia bacterium]